MFMVKSNSNLSCRVLKRHFQKYLPVLAIYRLFSKLDVVCISQSIKETDDNRKVKELDFQVLLAQFGPDTICQALGENNLPKIDAIGNQIADSQHDSKDLRRLAYNLQQRTIVEDQTEQTEQKKNLTGSEQTKFKLRSYLQQKIAKPHIRDLILKIGRESPDFTLFNTFDNQKDFKDMLANDSNQAQQEMMHCL